MFPIGDDDSDRGTTPVVNYAFIGVNILVFLLLQQLGSNEAFTYAFSLVPKEVTTGVDLTGPYILRDTLGHSAEIMQYPTPLPVYFNFLSSMFMHGGLAHIFGNMLFLWVFGDNLEDLIGHVRYLFFYLLCGFGAAAAQVAMDPDSVIPMLGRPELSQAC
jgi:membrane associated rhomboid family serine protease